MKSSLEGLTRDRVVQNARVHHLLHCFSAARYPDYRHFWEGDLESGAYVYENGQGDALALHWEPERVVGVVHDHESPRSEDETVPPLELPWIAPLVDAHRPALTRALQLGKTHGAFWVPTSAFAADRNGVHFAEDPADALEHGLWQVERYAMEPQAAVLTGRSQSWMELASVPRALAKVAVELGPNPAGVLTSKQLRPLVAFAAPRALLRERVEQALERVRAAGLGVEPFDPALLEPKAAIVELAAVKREPRGTAIRSETLEKLGLSLMLLDPTRHPRTEWAQVLAVVISTPSVAGWDPGEPDHPGPSLELIDADGRSLPFQLHVVDDFGAGFRRVMTLRCEQAIPQDATLRLKFLLDSGATR